MPRMEGTLNEKNQQSAVEKFRTPEEELAYLRERVQLKERELEGHRTDFERERIAKREVVHYQDTPASEVLEPAYQTPEESILQEALRLKPEDHDVQIDQLLKMVTHRGISNTLKVVSKMGSAHIEDDLHRALIQYIAEGFPTQGIKKGSEEWKALHMVLYEVSLPAQTAEDKNNTGRDLEHLLSSMEQFYSGMLSVMGTEKFSKKDVFTIEIAVQQGSEEAVFYVGVPRKKQELFKRHLISIFPNAQLEEVRGDYNIFNYGGLHAGAYGVLENDPAYPLKEYKEFVHDPLNIMLSAFSKLKKHGEGAAIQFVIGDDGDSYNRKFKKVIDNLREGKNAKKAIKHGTQPFSEALDTIGETLGDVLLNRSSNTHKDKAVDQLTLETITKKANSRIVPINVRIIASAAEPERAEDIIENIASTFNQFEDAQGNALRFIMERGSALRAFLHAFTFRTLNMKRLQPVSLKELTAMCHLTGQGVSTSRELKQTRAKNVSAPIEVADDDEVGTVSQAPAPRETPAQPNTDPVSASAESAPYQVPNKRGVVLGKNVFGGTETLVKFLPEDRMRHFYEIGQTGTGKTNLMKNMIIQDIKNGEGCCYIDPHGSDIVDILAAIPPERYDDVIYFDPAYTQRPMGLNIMEFDPRFPEQKTFVVNEIFSIFEKLFLAKSPESLGPMFEQYFRNAALLVLEGMEPGTATMADIPRVLGNAEFRHTCLVNSKNPIVNQFWEEIAEKADGEASLGNIVPYITAKTDIFLSNSTIRPILTQEKSSFNFREIMDSRKILLVNLSKGRLGDLNAELLGLIIVGKFLQAALSRVDTISEGKKDIADFYLYIDEFQNFTTPSIATILSEARKYRLSLNIAHQFVAQLDERIRDAVFGNVGTKCVFRVGNEDAEFLEKQFKPDFTAADIVGLNNYNAYVALLVNGKPVRPFNMETLPPEPADFEKVATIKQLSYERYGRDTAEIEAALAKKYARKEPEQFGSFSPSDFL